MTDTMSNGDVQAALAFAAEWLAGWNAHDVDRILDHFRGDAIFTSPVAAHLLPDTAGILRGKNAIRRYWNRGLEVVPDLHFEIEQVYVGTDTLVINFRNQAHELGNEVLQFDDRLVVRGSGTYPIGSP